MTLLQRIIKLIENISVTDRQEENILASLTNIEKTIKDSTANLHIKRTFTNGSYERDTIIRPLDDIDMFAVLDKEKWQDYYGNLPSPQSVLSKIKDYLNGTNDYKDKAVQDRPCVTLTLSDKNFDILPSFEQLVGLLMPSYDLKSWISTYPEKLTTDLNAVNKLRRFKIKDTIKAVKYWNRLHDMLIPSYHIEEVAINIFNMYGFVNYEESIRLWFTHAEYYLYISKFKSMNDYNTALKNVKKVKDQLAEAKKKFDVDDEDGAILIWKEIFGKEFPISNIEEAKAFSEAMVNGDLKTSPIGILSMTIGSTVPKTKGFYGEETED